MSKRKHRHRAGKRKDHRSKIRFDTFSVSEEDHPKFKAAMTEAALAAVAEFPKTLDLVKDQLRHHDPIGIMACYAGYGLLSFGSEDGSTGKPVADVLQHHAELLQAIVLSIPQDQWGPAPVLPHIMQTVFDSMPKLSDTFFMQRSLDGQKISDPQELAVLELQERIRLHTMAVRNWAHFLSVIQISKELYGPLDASFVAHHGFSCTDLIEVMHCGVREYERRQTEHWGRFRRVLRGRNPRQIFRLYFQNVPGLVGNAEQMLASMPGIDLDGAKAAVMSHYDLRIADFGTFPPDDLARLSGRTAQVVEKILRSISLKPGSLSEARTEYLFLGNPVWETPAIDLEDRFFLPIPVAVFSHIHRIVERLARAAGLKEALERTRSKYLQQKLETTLRSALPGAKITPGATWKLGDQGFETDVLIVIDRTVLAVEAKANRLTPEGLRGAPARVKRHVQEMVLDPSIQSERLANVIARAQAGDEASIAIAAGLGIDPASVDRVIRLSVTLDDLSVLSSAEAEFKKVGWVPQEHELAPTLLIADLICIVDILDKPLLLLHYLSERTYLQKAHDLLGDELDYLGIYLDNGFNFVLPQKDVLFNVAGLSGPIDRYYNALNAGITLPKPKPILSSLFTQIIDRLNEKRPMGWTTVGIHLLGAANPSEQWRIERELDKLRTMVRKNYRAPEHVSSMQIQPPQEHKARVGFYLFPEQLRPELKQSLEQLANQALDGSGGRAVALFARSTERWDLPYEAAVCVQKRKPLVATAGV
ncbi:hypothetical protein [Bradyrhizobium japonicum]|uniref:hypothetical protein n=1 Tax=Bradyrhizobium japonicum TaxID=375 RepID=UPI000456CAF9|nr:hypothetical protein [Bradyrhizobium japonicum]AHY52441.1 hypothetical protein BJS_05997 [Bradyrhizobium japonicum SEMIA 5079]MCD9110308.1 hypothetical protein [Bradyrhizobium japonicum]MCD9257487.1 hypothetical protein [Bradyrhizobium japonicum SEMIA 5079]MCD9823537.1 hypothetical protein [Bradyrhizobium japonicum]MCD9895151.1 hypothetical protein [Bradyrhizobium japonicum]